MPICKNFILIAAAGMLSLYSGISNAEEHPLNGFYAGISAGIIVLDSTVQFNATPTQPARKYVDQGGDGIAIDLRGGWGQLVSRSVYLGVEGEVIFPINVTSRLRTPENEYRARLPTEFGAYGRIGLTPDGRSMVFARAGVTVPRPRFQTTIGQEQKNEDWTLVPAVGIGAEINMTRNLVVRVDATYAIPLGENIIESYRFSGGIAWRF